MYLFMHSLYRESNQGHWWMWNREKVQHHIVSSLLNLSTGFHQPVLMTLCHTLVHLIPAPLAHFDVWYRSIRHPLEASGTMWHQRETRRVVTEYKEWESGFREVFGVVDRHIRHRTFKQEGSAWSKTGFSTQDCLCLTMAMSSFRFWCLNLTFP